MRRSEFEQVVGGALRELEYELEAEDEPRWGTRHLVEYKTLPGGAFSARVSGFDLHSNTSPDPDVIGLHNAAADRIAREIVAKRNEDRMVIFPVPQCVIVAVTGFLDPGSEASSRDFGLDRSRAQALWARVLARLNALADIPPGDLCVKTGKAGDADMIDAKPLFPSTASVGRHLNRRVVVTVRKGDCPDACRKRPARRF